ncbi:TrmB family transcriptional regulator [Vibrio sp. WXL210]|uniref:TrmB family transcriptional regulator n=1 Tax=Vibrio sp. WXL210 TaxID=3450709 RepID=UPI003EC55572
MTDLITKLMDFGFTKTDAMVYINLLKNGKGSGYKIAKEISLSRSSVYSSIDNLYKNGFIFLSDGDTKEYEAKSPDLIFSQIEKKTVENISIVKKELSRMMLQDEKEFIYSISGFDNLMDKARELFEQAQLEIYLNTDFDLSVFSDEINNAIDRGIRIIAFSFNKISLPNDKIEFYNRIDIEEKDYPSHRFMMVVDAKYMLSFSHREESLGVYSNNKMLITITAEHIHSDIYMSEYIKRMPDVSIKVNSIHEQTNEIIMDGQLREPEK